MEKAVRKSRSGSFGSPVRTSPSAEGEPSAPISAFAVDLYRQLAATPGNLLFSPFSIAAALAMTYAGARGETAAQMAHALHLPEQNETHQLFAGLRARMEEIGQGGAVNLRMANRLWPQAGYPFLPAFLDICREAYGAAITPVDYREPEAARQMINGWAAEATEEKIQNLIPEGGVDALTRLVLANAVFFKGNWAQQFDSARTESAPFRVGPGESVDVAMMHQTARFPYNETDSVQILALPFVGDDLALTVVLPKEPELLSELEQALSPALLASWRQHLYPREIDLYLPRFRASSNFRLDAALQALGMTDLFDDGRVDLSGMDGIPRRLYVAAVFHQAWMEANEEGAEAAAATAVVVGLRSAPQPPALFRADHPFLILLQEKQSGSLLFLGRVMNPLDTTNG